MLTRIDEAMVPKKRYFETGVAVKPEASIVEPARVMIEVNAHVLWTNHMLELSAEHSVLPKRQPTRSQMVVRLN